jgi:Protein of unknown function (DUF3237)
MPEINTGFPFMLAREIQVSSLGPQHPRMFHLRMFHFDGGSFEGPKHKGRVLPGGGDWSPIRRDVVVEMDAQLILETNDNHQIYPAWKGLGHLKVCAMVEDHCSAASALPSVGPQLT